MFKKNTFFNEMLREEILGDEFDVADESVFVDGWDIACLFKNIQWLCDSMRVQFERLLEYSADHFFAIDVEDLLKMFYDKCFNYLLDIFCDLILQQKMQFVDPLL